MKYLLMICILFSGFLHAEESVILGCSVYSEIEFQTDGHFSMRRYVDNETIVFTLCSHKKSKQYFISIDQLPSEGAFTLMVDKIPNNLTVIRDITYQEKSWILGLSEADYAGLYASFSQIIEKPPKDSVHELDGAMWCLSNTQSKSLCYWSPFVNTDKRDLSKIAQLGKKFWALALFEDGEKVLY
jgi:hypothetical protein